MAEPAVPVQFDWHETNDRIWLDPHQLTRILLDNGHHDAAVIVSDLNRAAGRAHEGQVLDHGPTLLPHLVDGPAEVHADAEVRTVTHYGRVYADLLDLADLYSRLGQARVRASGLVAELRSLERRALEPPRRRWFGRQVTHG